MAFAPLQMEKGVEEAEGLPNLDSHSLFQEVAWGLQDDDEGLLEPGQRNDVLTGHGSQNRNLRLVEGVDDGALAQ